MISMMQQVIYIDREIDQRFICCLLGNRHGKLNHVQYSIDDVFPPYNKGYKQNSKYAFSFSNTNVHTTSHLSSFG